MAGNPLGAAASVDFGCSDVAMSKPTYDALYAVGIKVSPGPATSFHLVHAYCHGHPEFSSQHYQHVARTDVLQVIHIPIMIAPVSFFVNIPNSALPSQMLRLSTCTIASIFQVRELKTLTGCSELYIMQTPTVVCRTYFSHFACREASSPGTTPPSQQITQGSHCRLNRSSPSSEIRHRARMPSCRSTCPRYGCSRTTRTG